MALPMPRTSKLKLKVAAREVAERVAGARPAEALSRLRWSWTSVASVSVVSDAMCDERREERDTVVATSLVGYLRSMGSEGFGSAVDGVFFEVVFDAFAGAAAVATSTTEHMSAKARLRVERDESMMK